MRQSPPRVLVYTYGTRGDVEPFLALAIGLQAAGFQTLLATSTRFQDWIESFDIPFFGLSDESLAVIESADGKAMLEGGSTIFSRIAAGARLARKSGPINKKLTRETLAAAELFRPDAIVYNVKVFAAPHVAEKLQVPAFLGALQPMVVPTSAFPALGLPRLSLPGYNRFTYALVRASYSLFRKSISRFRREKLSLPPIRKSSDVLFPPGAGNIPVLHAISPHVLSRPADWPASARITGYWRLEKSGDYTPPPDLAAFIDGKPPPVFVGFGSMTSADPTGLGRLVVGALRKAGQRGVIGKGWANVAVEDADDVIAIPPVPYGWLFPRMAAVVHHGGAGTTAEGFHAGVPSVICPFFGDQPGWGRVSVELGVGVDPIPRSRLSEDKLADAIQEAVSNPQLREKAQKLAAALANENGVGVAVDLIKNSIGETGSVNNR